MLIHNLVITGSLQYNGTNVTSITSSEASINSLNQTTASLNQATASLSSSIAILSGSYLTTSASYSTASGSLSTRVTTIESKYATTGSNVFTSNQTICGNLTTTGTITAQTINVQQVTSSIVYSSGSNVFGCQLSDVQQFTGSVFITGSVLRLTSGSICSNGNMCIGGLSVVYGCVGINTNGPQRALHIANNTENGIYISCNSQQLVIGNNHTFASKTCSTTIALAGGNSDYFPTSTAGDTIIATQCGNMLFGTGMNAGVASGTERMRMTNSGVILINCSVQNGYGGTIPRVEIYGTSVSSADADGGTLAVLGSNNTAGAGGAIVLGGSATTAYATWGRIRAPKDNATSANLAGGLAFDTRAAASNFTERLVITSAGIACFASTVCSPAIDIMPSGVGVNTTGGILKVVTTGTSTGIGIGQSNANRYTHFAANDIQVFNDDYFITTRCAFPLSIGTCYTARLTFSATGIACFSCQVCAAGFYASTVQSGITIDSTTNGDTIIASRGMNTSLHGIVRTVGQNGTTCMQIISTRSTTDGNLPASVNALWGLSNHDMVIATNNTERMRITGANILLTQDATIYNTTGNLFMRAGTSGDLILGGGGGNDKMRITSGGSVVLTTGISGPRFFSYCADMCNLNGLGLDMAGCSYEFGLFFAYGTSDNGRISFGSYQQTCYRSKMIILGSGNIGVPGNATAIYNASDSRLKNNIEPLNYGLAQVMCINPVKFNWKHEFLGEECCRNNFGFVAQQVQSILPDLVEQFGGSDIILSDGTVVDTPLRINEKNLTAVLVKAIQELKCENDLFKSCLGIS